MTALASTHMTRTRQSVDEAETRVHVWDPCPTCWQQGAIWSPDEDGRLERHTCPTCLGMRCLMRAER